MFLEALLLTFKLLHDMTSERVGLGLVLSPQCHLEKMHLKCYLRVILFKDLKRYNSRCLRLLRIPVQFLLDYW